MRIASIEVDGQRRFGRVEGRDFVPLKLGTDPMNLLSPNCGDLNWDAPIPFKPDGPLFPPIPITSIRDFITFEQHTAGSLRAVTGSVEIPNAWYEAPAFYFSNPHGAVGSGNDIAIPPRCNVFDFELEVGAVISKDGYNLSPEEAVEHIGGLTILNDWSARDIQQTEMKVGLGPTKSKDTATTIGPVIVTTDELADTLTDDGRYALDLSVKLNGNTIGTDNLSNMAWSFAELVSYASRGTWVKAGDIIGSGTCGGGCLAEYWGWFGQDSVPSLNTGDEVTMIVEKIGTITNTVTAGLPFYPLPRAKQIKWKQPPQPTLRTHKHN